MVVLQLLIVSGDATICTGASATISVVLTGTAPWDLTINDGTSTSIVTGITASPYTFTTSTAGTYTIDVVTDATCTGTSTGSAQIDIVTGIAISNLVETCDGTDPNYTVTFDITGGDVASYAVTGGPGTITGSTFTSDPIVSGTSYTFTADDDNSCSPQTVSNTVNCGCAATADISEMQQFVRVVQLRFRLL